MKLRNLLVLVITPIFVLALDTEKMTTKSACVRTFNKSQERAKIEALELAKRFAVDELFGTYIKSIKEVKDFTLK